MATVPPGPTSALPASPADISPFPTAGNVEAAEDDGEPACRMEERGVISTGKKSVSQVKTALKNKKKNMLARSSPAALHLQIQAREQQQLNGLASPSEDDDSHEHSGNRPDNPRPSLDNCDSGSGARSDDMSAVKNNSEHFPREGHSPFSENGRHSPLVSNSMNGVPGLTRTEGAHGHSGDDGKEDVFDRSEAPRPPSVKTHESPGAGGDDPDDDPQEPLSAEMARLELGTFPRQTEGDSHGICYVRYESELQMPWIMRLITKDLSEPYSIYTYRYFIHNWPQLCFLVSVTAKRVTVIDGVKLERVVRGLEVTGAEQADKQHSQHTVIS